MIQNDSNSRTSHPGIVRKPYCSVGAGQITSFIWKTGDRDAGWRYCFNLFRLSVSGGKVSQLFKPSDLMSLVKLIQVAASVIADDGCLEQKERTELRRLANDLDELLETRRAMAMRTQERATTINPNTQEPSDGRSTPS